MGKDALLVELAIQKGFAVGHRLFVYDSSLQYSTKDSRDRVRPQLNACGTDETTCTEENSGRRLEQGYECK